MKELYRLLNQLDYGKDNELITVIKGSHIGTKALLTGGKVMWSCPAIRDPEACPEGDDSNFLRADSDSVYREKLGHVQTVVVCGAGTVGLAVISLSKFLGWKVISVEDRADFAAAASKAGADRVLCGEFSQKLSEIEYDDDTFFVIVTREHCYDRACLDEILKHPFGYVGMMGSHKRTAKMRSALREAGWPNELIESIHAPIGVPIEAQTPEEIAVSITAQMIQEKERNSERYHFPDDILREILEIYRKQDEGEDAHAVLATVTRQTGSTPRKAGARMLVYPDGSITGTIGGGSMEAEIIRRAVEGLSGQSPFKPSLLTIDLTGKSGDYIDMLCGGMTDVFSEMI